MGSHNTPSAGRIVVAVLLGSVYGLATVLVLFVGALYVLTARNAGDNPGVVVNEAPLVILPLFIFWRVRREFRRAARKSQQG
jgi:hypothetical protein